MEGMNFAKVRGSLILYLPYQAIEKQLLVCTCVQDLDEFVVGVREDNLLHCYDLSTGNFEEVLAMQCGMCS